MSNPPNSADPGRLPLPPGEILDGKEPLDVYKVAVEMYKMEGDRFWTRSNVYILVSSGLLVTYSSFAAKPWLACGIACAGLLVAVMWLGVSFHSEYYVLQWREIVRRIESQMRLQPFHMFPKDAVAFGGTGTLNGLWARIQRGGPSRFMHLTIAGFIFIWYVFLLVAVYRMSEEAFSGPGTAEPSRLERSEGEPRPPLACAGELRVADACNAKAQRPWGPPASASAPRASARTAASAPASSGKASAAAAARR